MDPDTEAFLDRFDKVGGPQARVSLQMLAGKGHDIVG
jgi:hypothetical protein